MVSAVENMAANTSWSALGKATDLRNRILFTLGLLIVYRLGTFIPVPGIDGVALREFMDQAGQGIGGMVRRMLLSVHHTPQIASESGPSYSVCGKSHTRLF